MARALHLVAVVPSLEVGRNLVAAHPQITTVTRDGDVVASHLVSGGSSAQPSLLEAQARLDEAKDRLAEAEHTLERLRFARAGVEDEHRAASRDVEVALAQLHESDAVMSALAEELGQLSAQARGSSAEAGRLGEAIAKAEAAREADAVGLVALQERLAAAEASTGDEEPDPAARDALGEQARTARAAEMDARLALRTQEERARALAGRSETLRRAARAERDARAQAHARRERMRREARVAAAVEAGGQHLLGLVERSLARAAEQRAEVDAVRADADAALGESRGRARRLGAELETLVDEAHRDEMARTEQRLRVENLVEKAATELALDAEVLVAEFGPDQLVPVIARPDGTALPAPEDLAEGEELPEPRPYVREEQSARLRKAERALAVLGRVNPLALEEFDAMEERHRFLAEQLDDLRRTRKDLIDIIADVDARVEQVFAEAYADVEVAFARVFSRLFPGGEGRLVLTEPGDWLTTGHRRRGAPGGQEGQAALAALGRRAFAGRRRVPGVAVHRAAEPVLHPRRGRGRARRHQPGPAARHLHRAPRQQPAARHHAPEADDGDRRRAVRRDHARRRRLRGHLPAPAGGRGGRLSRCRPLFPGPRSRAPACPDLGGRASSERSRMPGETGERR